MIAGFLHRLESVFAWVLEASWQASVLVALVLLLQLTLRGRLNPRWYHALWLLVVLRLILPVLPESALSLFQFTPPAPHLIEQSVTEPIFVASPVQPVIAANVPSPALVYPFSVYTFLALIWLGGAVGLFLVTWTVNYRFARHVRKAAVIDDPRLLAIAADAQAKLGIHRHLRLIESAQAQGPAIMGLFHPTIVLPEGVRAKFTDEELRFIFLHEFAHLKRGDLIVQWLIALLQVLHWFNPVLWYAFRRMRIDREPATDALVLSRAGEAQREPYGHVLIKLLEHFHQRHSLPTLVGILEDKDQFKRRFLLIGKFSRGAYGWSLLGVVLIAALGAICLTKAKAQETASNPTNGTLAQMALALHDNAKAIPTDHQRLQILQSFYGADGSWRDVTGILQKSVKNNSLTISWQQPYTEIGGDPAYLQVKTLIVSYRLDGNEKQATFREENPPVGLQATIPTANEAKSSQPDDQLLNAVRKGDAAAVQKLFDQGANPKSVALDGKTLLFDAGSPEVAELLIQKGVALDAKDKQGETALYRICLASRNPSKIVGVLLKHGADSNVRDNNDVTPLMFAPDGATVDVLVQYGADIKAKNKYGGVVENPMGDATRLKALIAHGAPFNPKTEGPTMMMSAAHLDHVDVIAYLLSLGVDPNQKGTWSKEAKMYSTPLETAVTFGHLDAAKLLSDHGAKVQPNTVEGKPGPDEMVGAIYNRRKDIVKLFWEHGQRSISELTYAISQGEPVGKIKILLDGGVPPDPPQDKFITPLTLAAELGQLDVVILLVQRGAKINGHIAPDASPIDQAAWEGQDEVVSFLLEHGAEPGYQAVWNVAWNANPYPDQRSKDHFEKTLKLLIDAGTLKEMTPEQKGHLLDAVIGTRYPGGNAIALKMLLGAGLSPDLPMTDMKGKKLGTVLSYYREIRAKNPHDDFNVYPLIDMLEDANKKGATKSETEIAPPDGDAPVVASTKTDPVASSPIRDDFARVQVLAIEFPERDYQANRPKIDDSIIHGYYQTLQKFAFARIIADSALPAVKWGHPSELRTGTFNPDLFFKLTPSLARDNINTTITGTMGIRSSEWIDHPGTTRYLQLGAIEGPPISFTSRPQQLVAFPLEGIIEPPIVHQPESQKPYRLFVFFSVWPQQEPPVDALTDIQKVSYTNDSANAVSPVASTDGVDETYFGEALKKDSQLTADSRVHTSTLQADAQMLLAIQKGDVAALKEVLEHAVEPNTFDPDRFNHSPVFWAVHFNQPECLKLLLDHMAYDDGPTHLASQSALELAQRAHPDLVPILQEGLKQNRTILTTRLIANLHSIHIDLPNFSNASLKDVTTFLLQATSQAGYLERRVTIGYMDLPPSSTLNAPAKSNITLWDALQTIASANNLQFDAMDQSVGTITLYPSAAEAIIHPSTNQQ